MICSEAVSRGDGSGLLFDHGCRLSDGYERGEEVSEYVREVRYGDRE